jgi:hypothetical protein
MNRTFHEPFTRAAVTRALAEVHFWGGRPQALRISRVDFDQLPIVEFIALGDPLPILIDDELNPGYWQIVYE